MRLARVVTVGVVVACWSVLVASHLAAQGPALKKATDALGALSSAFQDVAGRVSPAVVEVTVTGFGAESRAVGPSAGPLSPQRSAGSGVIIVPEGYIVTNAHVVEGARHVDVRLAVSVEGKTQWLSILKPRGRLVPAKIVGVDRETDLAVLKIEEQDLPVLELADSDAVRQGQLVMAFGSPLGLDNSVSLGVVSSVARQLRPEDPMIYIQTDATINPGNSGGPLVDTEGRVVGINTFIFSQSGGSEGIGFAAPSNIVRHVLDEIRKSGRVRRGQVGVVAQTVTPILAAGLGLAQDWGVILADVTPRGAADIAGFKIGDLVLTLDGKVMENARQFDVNIYQRPIGNLVTLEILRGAEKLTKQVAVLERPNDLDRLADLLGRETTPIPRLGILVAKLDGRILEVLPGSRRLSGVAVTALVAEAPAFGQPFLPGDIIYEVNRTPVMDVESLQAALGGLKVGDPAVVQIERQQKLNFVAFRLQ